MRSRRLIGLTSVLLLAGVLFLVWHDSSTTPTSQTGGTSSSSTPPATLPATPPGSDGDLAHDHDHDHDHDHADLEPQLSVVRAFADAFTAGGPQRRWIAGLHPYVTPDLLAGFTYTDPRLRPTGKVVKVAHLQPGELFKVEVRGGQSLTCTVVAASGGQWVVNSFEPIEMPLPTGRDV
jgi:hypothetical protein